MTRSGKTADWIALFSPTTTMDRNTVALYQRPTTGSDWPRVYHWTGPTERDMQNLFGLFDALGITIRGRSDLVPDGTEELPRLVDACTGERYAAARWAFVDAKAGGSGGQCRWWHRLGRHSWVSGSHCVPCCLTTKSAGAGPVNDRRLRRFLRSES